MNSAELTRALRAARPTAGDALRLRVRELAAREPHPQRSFFDRFSPRHFGAVVLPAAALTALVAAGAIGLARSGGSGSANPQGTTAVRESAPAPGAAQDQATGQAPTAPPAVGPAPGRPERYSAQLTLEVDDADALSAATQRALQITRSLGGYAVSVSYGSAEESGTSSLVVRVPTARVQDAIVRLSALGTIVGQQVQIDDLGGQLGELAQRESSLREQIARLTARLGQTNLTTEQRVVLAARRAAAQRSLADVRQAQASLRREAGLATISLALRTGEAAAVPATPSRLDGTLDEALNVLAWEGIAVLYAAIVLAPLALLAAVGLLGARFWRRRENERLLAAS